MAQEQSTPYITRTTFDAERTWPAEHAARATRGARSRGARGLGARCAEHAVFAELARRAAAAALPTCCCCCSPLDVRRLRRAPSHEAIRAVSHSQRGAAAPGVHTCSRTQGNERICGPVPYYEGGSLGPVERTEPPPAPSSRERRQRGSVGRCGHCTRPRARVRRGRPVGSGG